MSGKEAQEDRLEMNRAIVVFENALPCKRPVAAVRMRRAIPVFDIRPDLALISDSAVNRKSKDCNESISVIRLFIREEGQSLSIRYSRTSPAAPPITSKQ